MGGKVRAVRLESFTSTPEWVRLYKRNLSMKTNTNLEKQTFLQDLGVTEGEALVINSNDDITHIVHTITAIALKMHNTGLHTSQQAKHFLGFYNLVHYSKEGRVTKKNEHRAYFIKKKIGTELLFEIVSQGNPKARVADGFAVTQLCEDVIVTVYELFSSLEFQDSDVDVDPEDSFCISIEILSQIKYSDRIVLLDNIITYRDKHFIIDLKKDQKDGDGRVYSTFTQISSDTRKLLGYINYDLDTAMQAITLQLTVDPSKYSLHQELTADKRSFRKRFAEDAAITIDEAKEYLTSLDNKKTFKGAGAIGQEYVAEAIQIHTEVLQRTQEQEPDLYNRCEQKAKYGKYDYDKKGKNPYSIYFHIWTHYEKLIRDAMKTVFKEPELVIDLHDAVYSKETVDVTLLEEAVYEQTGFRVKISH